MMPTPRVKICCIANITEARLAMPSGPRVIAEDDIAAIDAVAPFGLDLCSSVRTDGRLDAAKLHAFFQAITAP